MSSIAGSWSVSHGLLHIAYSFADNGNYRYQRYGSGRDEEETGTYVVQGDSLILEPQGKPQRVLRWSVGTHPTALPGERILRLVDQYGDQEIFYPKA
jgi:hypothetical protein